MSDLDDDLLALAGDGVSDSEFEPQLSKSELESSKRKRDEDNDEFDDEDEDEDELVNPYPLEGKYRDADDRENLLAMDEIQREQTLFDRSQEMERYNEKKYLQQRMKQQKTQNEVSKTRSSARSKLVKETAKGSKLDKLSELRKQREQKSRREKRKQDYDDYEEDEDQDEDDDDNLDDGLEDEEGEEEDDYYDNKVSWGSGSSRVGRLIRSNERANFESVSQVKVGRSMLSRFCYYNEFNESILDCFGRINVGMDKRTRRPIYRMVQIVDVKNIPQKAYKFPTTMVDIYLTVAQNSKQKKDFPMNVFSDSPITNDEFERYKAELIKNDEDLPYLDDIKEKAEVLRYLSTKEISDKDVNAMLKRKQNLQKSTSLSSFDNLEGFDVVYQKSKIKDELIVAGQEGDISKINKLEEKLASLENILNNSTKQKADAATNSMSKVNERNRKLNKTNIRLAELKSSQQKKLSDTTNDGGDPFSRFKTNTRIFYEEIINEENEKALVDAKLNYEKELAEKNQNEAKIASSSYRSLGVMDELIKNIDVNIELQI